MKLYRTWICPLVIFTLLLSCAAPARATLLSDLIGLGQSIQVGDLQFGNFSYSPTGDMPAATAIDVTPYSTLSGDYGLTFSGAFGDLPGGEASDAIIGYHVSELFLGSNIVGAVLMGDPTVSGGNGIASVTETFLPGDPSDTLSIYSIVVGSTQSINSLSFSQGYQDLDVQEAFLALSLGTGAGFSFITPAFTSNTVVIPEPGTFVLLGIGIAALTCGKLARGRRNRIR